MDPASLTFSVLSLFTVCMDVFERFESFREADQGQRHVYARFEAEKIRLRDWGKAVGISNGKLDDSHDAALDDAETLRSVKNVLISLGDLVDPSEAKISKLGLDIDQSDPYAVFPPGAQSRRAKESSKPFLPRHKRKGIAWAMMRKDQATGTVDEIKALVDLLYQLTRPLSQHDATVHLALERLIQRMTADRARRDRKAIAEWLNVATLLDQRLEDLQTCRLNGTCRWLFEVPAYKAWLATSEACDPSRLLWINGPAGYGKSVLCAEIVQRLKSETPDSVAHFFPSDSQFIDRLDGVVREWLARLAYVNTRIQEAVLQHMNDSSKTDIATSDTVWAVFESVISLDGQWTFVLDGLDEYPNIDDRRRTFLQQLKKSLNRGNCRVLIMSRDEIDIRQQLCCGSTHEAKTSFYEHKISVEDVRSDVLSYAKDVVETRLSKKSSRTKENIANSMAQKSDGMFLWIRLQKDQLRGTASSRENHQIIATMPADLTSAYERNWKAINSRPAATKIRAVKTLAWVLHAVRPLTVSELAGALAVQSQTGYGSDLEDASDNGFNSSSEDSVQIDQDYIDEEVVDMCGSLLETRAGADPEDLTSRTVHLVHFSVREYLISVALAISSFDDPLRSGIHENTAHVELAQCCIRHLGVKNAWEILKTGVTSEKKSTFLSYAASSWHLHVKAAGPAHGELLCLLTEFLDPSNLNFDSWRVYFEEDAIERNMDCRPSRLTETIQSSPLYYLALFNLHWITRSFRERWCVYLNSIGGSYGTPLQAACAFGNEEAFELLMAWEADVNRIGGWHGTAANAAAAGGHTKMVTKLLAAGANPALSDSRGRTTLYTACWKGQLDVLVLLIGEQSLLEVSDINKTTPLNAAASSGHVQVVSLLFDKGADHATRSSEGWTPLHFAAFEGSVDVAKLLLEKGADVALKDDDGSTPLHFAAFEGSVDVVKLLLEKGADHATKSSEGWTPLYFAASKGSVDGAKLLLENGADHATRCSEGWTPLHFAASKGYVDVVKLLFEKGADCSPSTDSEWTPLHEAASEGHADIVKLLLDKGADCSPSFDSGSTPLHDAAFKGYVDVVKLLLEKGRTTLQPRTKAPDSDTNQADVYVNAKDISGLSALHWAARHNRVEIARLVLDHGGAVDNIDIMGNTALHVAAQQGHEEMVDLLLLSKADATMLDGYGKDISYYAQLHQPLLEPTAPRQDSRIINFEAKERLHNSVYTLACTLVNHNYNPVLFTTRLGRCMLFLHLPLYALKAFRHSVATSSNQGKIRHPGASCNGCDEYPIVGDRHVCKVCPDMDLCDSCRRNEACAVYQRTCATHDFLTVSGTDASTSSTAKAESAEDWKAWLEQLKVEFAPATSQE